ncbi:GNAT family N-acetyltransferase [Sphingomonas donggukensis]|uniref:GNAT family N-acetyltransferase n=1 Tax=Sphingomonas donggukensis TaxID=2949093 RepID=A0ABY4TV62_9SPHN|nr:GNAT family N-acetyltransferase [Sphingomonas donggukensis]URW76289.1 GNAT family N-acetyltransferase [Sphingomonas donggukensis]
MTPDLRFVEGDFDSADVIDLLRFHLASAHQSSPACKVHALDLTGLQRPDVRFWSVRGASGALLGMGALKTIEAGHGEIKSMRVAPAYLRRGIGAAILAHLLHEARAGGLTRVSLETGGNEAFAPARAMYERAGFAECPAFGEYVPDEFTRCYSRAL